jgi:acetylornithine deacetylase
VLVREAVAAELGREVALAGVPWGADMRLWTARGIPTVMVGTPGIELAHAVDERVRVDDLATVARAIVRVATTFAPTTTRSQ